MEISGQIENVGLFINPFWVAIFRSVKGFNKNSHRVDWCSTVGYGTNQDSKPNLQQPSRQTY